MGYTYGSGCEAKGTESRGRAKVSMQCIIARARTGRGADGIGDA